MATAEEIAAARKEQLDRRYRAKVEARATGKAPVFETSTPIDGSGRTPAAIDERYRLKLERHGRPAAPEAKPEGKAKKAEKPEGAPEAKPEGKSEPKAGG